MTKGVKMKLKTLREKINKTQKEVADELCIQRTKYARYENEESDPSIDMLLKLADYYKVTLDELVGHEVPYLIDKSLLSDEEISIINEIKELDTIQRIKVLAYIDGLKEGKQKHEAIIKQFEER